MSSADLKNEIGKWDEEERAFAEAYLKHLRRRNLLSNQTDLESGMREFDEGRSFSIEQVEKMHEALKTEGK